MVLGENVYNMNEIVGMLSVLSVESVKVVVVRVSSIA